MNPGVSIIMPCYNAAPHLPQSVGSVLSQTFTDWELIAIDDGSSDDTLTLLQAQKDPRIRVHTQSNQGVSAARNAGLALARGQYVAFLDADDTWAPTFLAKLFASLQGRPDAVLAYCGWQNIGLPGPRGEPFIPPDYETPAKLEALLGGCRWPIHAALTRRDAIVAAGGFNPLYTNAEDYALWLQVATVAPIARVAEVLAFYHFHGAAQASANHARAALQLWRAQREFIASHPQAISQIGSGQAAILSHGTLMQHGFECYWARDLDGARRIFRTVMRHGYGAPRKWLYMLPSWLPLSWHATALRLFERLMGQRNGKP
ncbi:glycosyltransferase family 2 protein [Sulfuriferula sp. GW1]|uniref:glycosyltransferase family 2 protein n=1 Tax=Sulfuriferula sp. GW1 TaxID=3345111 RepID=UPI0039AEA1BD